MSYTRVAALQPWYHKPKPRCAAETYNGTEQCLFSAAWEAELSGKRVYFCTTHKQMADFPMTLIQPVMVDL